MLLLPDSPIDTGVPPCFYLVHCEGESVLVEAVYGDDAERRALVLRPDWDDSEDLRLEYYTSFPSRLDEQGRSGQEFYLEELIDELDGHERYLWQPLSRPLIRTLMARTPRP